MGLKVFFKIMNQTTIEYNKVIGKVTLSFTPYPLFQ